MNAQDRADRARIQAKIASDTTFAVHVFQVVYSLQRPEEQFTRQHMGHDGVGFQAHEAERLNTFYEELQAQGWRLTAWQADKLRAAMKPYWRQVRDEARAKNARARSARKTRTDARGVRRLAGGGEVHFDRQAPPKGERYQTAAGKPATRDEKQEARNASDSLRGVFDGMTLDERVAAINRMADSMGV